MTWEKLNKRWARLRLLQELEEVRLVGLACNVQQWSAPGHKKAVKSCAARRREARRLLALATKAVREAK